MGATQIIAETGAGQHGVAYALKELKDKNALAISSISLEEGIKMSSERTCNFSPIKWERFLTLLFFHIHPGRRLLNTIFLKSRFNSFSNSKKHTVIIIFQ